MKDFRLIKWILIKVLSRCAAIGRCFRFFSGGFNFLTRSRVCLFVVFDFGFFGLVFAQMSTLTEVFTKRDSKPRPHFHLGNASPLQSIDHAREGPCGIVAKAKLATVVIAPDIQLAVDGLPDTKCLCFCLANLNVFKGNPLQEDLLWTPKFSEWTRAPDEHLFLGGD